jgi:hypothetical protein
MSISQRSNIFNVLGEDRLDASEEQKVSQKEAKRRRRIMEMVGKGQLIPRCEEDAEFWKLVSNKLQANACQEGVWDLSQAGKI